MKKPTLVVAILFAMTVPTLTSYAGPFDTLNARANSGQSYSAPYSDPAVLPGGRDNPWGVGSYIPKEGYLGRIVGTWQKRGADYFYVLPDGSDLKNNYVDNLYLSWTGRMIPENYVSENRFMYNNFYGGQAPTWANMDGFPGSITRGLTYVDLTNSYAHYQSEYSTGKWQTAIYAKEAMDWMDIQLPNIVNQSEQDRARVIAKIIADTLHYNGSQVNSADGFHQRAGGFEAFIGVYSEFARRAGISAWEGGNGTRYDGTDWRWNTVKINGTIYFVDVITYSQTKQDKYLLSPVLWEGYTLREVLNAQEQERIKQGVEQRQKEELANPTPQGGTRIDGEQGGAV